MPIRRSAQEADFTFEVEGYDDELRVLSFGGDEGISQLFRFGISLASEDGEIDIDSMIGQPAVLTIFHDNGERKIHGIVNRFEQGSEGRRFTPYDAGLVPEVWLLTQRFGCRIHQELSVPDIVEKVLTDAGIPGDRFRFALSGSYEPRDYCVQYRESDWNFISRLLEEEGIFYFFEHTDDACTLVIGDSTTAFVEIDSPAEVVFRDPSGTVAEEEAVVEYHYIQEIRPGKVSYRDYNFETPTVDMEKYAEASRDQQLEVYDYPGKYADPEAGATRTSLGMESFQTRRIIGYGQSLCRRFVPGFLYSLTDYPRLDFNREYLLTWISHSGTQPLGDEGIGGEPEYNNEFRSIPSDVPFRPAQRTSRPVVEGTQTAIVTGPSGEEIYPDEHGRVKVQFHWDREGEYDENTSCWIRVSQLWAGQGWGAMWIPRIGHEVIVDFLEGNPDKPIIIGRVYHGDNPPPYGLPDDKTKSTIKSDSSIGGGGSNEIRFEDLKGSEEIFIHAQKDMNEVIENNMSTSVGADQSLSVGHDRSKSVSNDETTTVTGNRTETVENGNETITINTGDRKIDVNTGDNILTVKTGDRKVAVNTGDDALEVKTGDRKVDVNTGDDLLVVKTGDHKVDVNAGDAVLTVKAGDRSVAVNAGDYQVATSSGDIKIDAKSNLEGKAAAEMILDAPKIGATGMTEVQITVGGSAIKLEPAKITLSSGSGQIILDPAGVTIVGALVKIN